MGRKSLSFIFVVGALLVIVGFVFATYFVGELTAGGKSDSILVVTLIRLIQYYAITFGILLILASTIIGYLPVGKRFLYLVLGVCVLGVAFAVLGVVLSPSFIETRLSPVGVLPQNALSWLSYLQIAAITLGCLLILASLLVYRRRSLSPKKSYSLVVVILVSVLFLVLVYVTYINANYPNNILSKPQEIGKVVDLLLGRDILLSDYQPRPILVVEREQIAKAKYPVIDVHFHLASMFQTEEDRKALAPEALLKSMDRVGVKMIVNLDGGMSNYERTLDLYHKRYPDRFINFYQVSFPLGIVPDEYITSRDDQLVELVRLYKKMGVRGYGLKLWKELGLNTRDTSGKVISVDDPRLDPLWAKAGELGLPVLWHMGDPAPFFRPVNRFNERYEELSRFPEWSFYGPRFPSREELLKQRENVLRKHPETIFIAAHMGDNTDNLGYIAYLLDTYPNYYVEISSRLSELGRQPYTAREFFIKYQDRILFGSDSGSLFGTEGWTVEKFYRAYFEFLETDNEYIRYPMQGAINQGRWRIYGINLPDEVLEKIYHKNAEKLLFKNKNGK